MMELEGVFVRALPIITEGGSMHSFLERQNPATRTPISFDEFYRFVRRDPGRLAEYEEAEQIGAEFLVAQIIPIADAHPDYCHPEEDSYSRKLRIDARKWKVEKWYRQKYGDVKRVEMTTTNITPENVANLSTDELKQYLIRQSSRLGNTIEGELVE